MKIIITILFVSLYLTSNSQSVNYLSEDRPTTKKKHKVKKHIDGEPWTPEEVGVAPGLDQNPNVQRNML